jgi:serine/threonine protein kinase/Flp pilus assembly protein TadD
MDEMEIPPHGGLPEGFAPDESIRPRMSAETNALPYAVQDIKWDETILPSTWGVVDETNVTLDMPGTRSTPGGLEPGAEENLTATFTLRRIVGRGGYGEVWEAQQASLGRLVAVKRIRQDQLDKARAQNPFEAELIEREFRQEAVTTGVLDHPNIVPVYDLGRDAEGSPLLAMKLVKGKSWSELLKEDLRIPLPDLLGKHLPILRQVAQAVAFAHAKGVIHRDLKPAQVMVGEFGEVILMDWGLAVSFQEMDKDARFDLDVLTPAVAAPQIRFAPNPAGTPSFMAPEQTLRTGDLLGPWTDIYLLGGILFYLLTGTPPHAGTSITRVMAHAMIGEIERPSERAKSREIPPELDDLCAAALSREPRDRTPSAEAFIAALDDYVTGSGRRRESVRFYEDAKSVLGDVSSADEESIIRAFAPLDHALARWSDNTPARLLLAEAKGRLTLVRATAMRRRRAAISIFVVVIIVFLSLTVWQEGRNEAAQERLASQSAFAERLGSINELRSREADLADRLSTVLPLPDTLLREPEELAFLAQNRERIDAFMVERAELRKTRLRLLGEGLRLDPEPYALLIGEANLMVRRADDRDLALKAYELYSAADAAQPGFPEGRIGMGIAAARAGYFTSATMVLEEGAERTRGIAGENNPKYAAALILTGEAYRKLDESGEAFRRYYRRSLDVLEPQLAALSHSIAEKQRALGEPSRNLEFTSPTLALALARGGENSDQIAAAHLAVAKDFYALGKYADARTHEEAAIAIYAQYLRPEDPRIIEAKQSLGQTYIDLGEFQAAVDIFRDALMLSEKQYPAGSVDISEARRRVALALYHAGRSEEALPMMRESIARLEKEFGADNRETSSAYNDLAVVLNDLRNYDLAEEYYRKALESSIAILGPDHPDVATRYNNLGYNAQMQGDYAAAIPLFREAWKIRSAKQGDAHPDTAMCANNLGSAYLGAEDYDRALEFIVRGYIPLRKSLGPNHPSVASLQNNIATCLSRMGRFEDAVQLHFLNGYILHEALPPDHPVLFDVDRNIVEAFVPVRPNPTPQESAAVLRMALALDAKLRATEEVPLYLFRRDAPTVESMVTYALATQAPPRLADASQSGMRLILTLDIQGLPLDDPGRAKTIERLQARIGDLPAEIPAVPDDLWRDKTTPIASAKVFGFIDSVAPRPDVSDIAAGEPFAISDILPPRAEVEAKVEIILDQLTKEAPNE